MVAWEQPNLFSLVGVPPKAPRPQNPHMIKAVTRSAVNFCHSPNMPAASCHRLHGTAPTCCCAAPLQTCNSTTHAEWCSLSVICSQSLCFLISDTSVCGPHLPLHGVDDITIFTAHHRPAGCHLTRSSLHTFPTATPLPIPARHRLEVCAS